MADKNLIDRVTYSEIRTINVGDYESVKTHLSYSTSIRKINEKENLLEIEASETVNVEEDKKNFEDTVKRAMGRVRKILNNREADIRARSARWTEHDTEGKALLLKLLPMRAFKKLKHKIQVDISDIESMDDSVEFVED